MFSFFKLFKLERNVFKQTDLYYKLVDQTPPTDPILLEAYQYELERNLETLRFTNYQIRRQHPYFARLPEAPGIIIEKPEVVADFATVGLRHKLIELDKYPKSILYKALQISRNNSDKARLAKIQSLISIDITSQYLDGLLNLHAFLSLWYEKEYIIFPICNDVELALVEAFAFHHRIDLYYRRIS